MINVILLFIVLYLSLLLLPPLLFFAYKYKMYVQNNNIVQYITFCFNNTRPRLQNIYFLNSYFFCVIEGNLLFLLQHSSFVFQFPSQHSLS
jgi:hypothetical protein